MSLAVSDSGPLHYLVLCEAIGAIAKLYGQLVIPAAVAQEFAHPHTPAAVRKWAQTPPQWARIESPARVDPATHLGPGEREAIALALELNATQLLVDDRAARRTAIERGLLVTGTVGILEEAAVRGFLNLSETLQKLANTNFWISADVVRELLNRDVARRKAGE